MAAWAASTSPSMAWHVEEGQLYRQRCGRAGLRAHQGRVLPGKDVTRLRALQGRLDAYVVHWNPRRRQVGLNVLASEEFQSQPIAAATALKLV